MSKISKSLKGLKIVKVTVHAIANDILINFADVFTHNL